MMQEMMNIGAALVFTAAMLPFYVWHMNGGVDRAVEAVVGYFTTVKEFADDA